MGCFSFLCKESGKAALSTSFDGSPVYMFLLRDGRVIEEMYGNYDSYGRVFRAGKKESFEWDTDWSVCCDLMFHPNVHNGIAVILKEHYNGEKPTTRSLSDPHQGWGDGSESFLMADTSDDIFEEVLEPYHKVYYPDNKGA